MKGAKICFFIGQDADDVLCFLAKLGGVGYPGEVEVFLGELVHVHVPGGCC